MKVHPTRIIQSCLALAGIGIASIALAGCPGDTMDSDGPSGSALYRIITETDPYVEWAQFPEADGIISSALPHGPLARVHINGPVEAALDNFGGQLPDGSIIVKESFDENMDESGDSITVMWKVAGFDPENNDWFWARFAFDGTIVAEGNVSGCVNCHGFPEPRANDFVYLHDFGQ